MTFVWVDSSLQEVWWNHLPNRFRTWIQIRCLVVVWTQKPTLIWVLMCINQSMWKGWWRTGGMCDEIWWSHKSSCVVDPSGVTSLWHVGLVNHPVCSMPYGWCCAVPCMHCVLSDWWQTHKQTLHMEEESCLSASLSSYLGYLQLALSMGPPWLVTCLPLNLGMRPDAVGTHAFHWLSQPWRQSFLQFALLLPLVIGWLVCE